MTPGWLSISGRDGSFSIISGTAPEDARFGVRFPGSVLGIYSCGLFLLSAFSSPGVQSACNRSTKKFLWA